MKRNQPFNKKSEQNIISFDTSVYDEELELLHYDLLDFAMDNYEDFLNENIVKQLPGISDYQDEEEYEAYISIFIPWAILHLPLEQKNLTTFDLFIKSLNTKNIRKRTKKIIQDWENSIPSGYQVVRTLDNYALMEDIMTGKQFKIKSMDELAFETDQLFIGTLVPFVDHSQFFFSAVEINQALKEDLESLLVSFEKQASLQHEFPAFLSKLTTMNPKVEYEWEKPIYEEVYRLFFKKNLEKETPEELLEIALKIWQQYCFQSMPKVTRINPYAGALDYFIQKFLTNNPNVTQKQIAKEYETTTTSISLYSRHFLSLIDELFKEMKEAEDLISNETKDEDDEEIEQVKALQLLIKAAEENPLTRKKMIHDALKIDPNLPEAYLMLAEDALSIEEKMVYLEKTIEIGERKFDNLLTAAEEENIWMHHETRGYLRAKELYAFYLVHYDRDIERGIKCYEELLALNPLDNQGIRYRLLTLYLEIEDYTKAERLLEDYQDEYTASFLFNKALLAYNKNGLTKETKDLLQEANQQNPYVKEYLLGRQKIPGEVDYIVLGEDSEAIEYAQENIHLYDDARELLQALSSFFI